MPIKKLDFKFINELRRNEHIKEIVKTINNNADVLDDNLLLINNSLETLFEGYSGDNASTKKIYIHPIILVNTASCSEIGISLFIFNQDPTPYTTWSAVKTALFAIATAINDTARFPVSGAIYSSGTLITCRNIDVRTNNTIGVYGSTSDSITSSVDITSYSIASVFDGVNAIN